MGHNKVFRVIDVILLLYGTSSPLFFTNIHLKITFTAKIFYYAEHFPFGLLEPHKPVNSKDRNLVSLFFLTLVEKSLA